MFNQVTLVGRLVEDPEINKNKDNKDKNSGSMVLAIQKNYKNADGVYETDFINVNLLNSIAQTTTEYCKKGDIVGVKGRLSSSNNQLNIIAEKVTFLSSKLDKKEEKEVDKDIKI